MNEPFHLHVTYSGQAYELPARFERWGYTHRFSVLIGDETFVFEPDEEGNYRVLTTAVASATLNTGLLQATAERLAALNTN
ncbi:hypothetical protein [Mucilaginibacter terrae]|uniref:Uncharacterized protein n=1 Tax=Mucilaginibacter terrae TaxID=1955052 RepID=A0ABU3GND2_9SPHI|nr:hypothetical protein [Mucilaginibacter terrae]MDT3401299.1 hypothetical protein [Mucilaginibacter terrae]